MFKFFLVLIVLFSVSSFGSTVFAENELDGNNFYNTDFGDVDTGKKVLDNTEPEVSKCLLTDKNIIILFVILMLLCLVVLNISLFFVYNTYRKNYDRAEELFKKIEEMIDVFRKIESTEELPAEVSEDTTPEIT